MFVGRKHKHLHLSCPIVVGCEELRLCEAVQGGQA